MKAITALGLAALLLAFTPVYSAGPASPKGDAPRLTGTYRIVAGEKFGQQLTEERVKGHKVTFTEDKVVVTDKDKKETYVATYRLDASTKPWRITMTSVLAPTKGRVARGLIEKDGGTVRLVYAVPGGEVPIQFKTTDKQLMFEMQAVKE